MRWTEEQKQAIDNRERELLIAAAAGSGKTAVLSERILRVLREGGELSRMMVVTFTNAAAEEMKRRIRRKIREAQKKEEASNRWQRQLDQLEWASIQTFHSFCKKVIDQNLYLLPYDKGYSLIQPQDRTRIRMEEIRGVLELYYDTQDEDLQAVFLQYRSPKSDRRLIEILDRIQNFMQRQPGRKLTISSKEVWEDLLRTEMMIALESLEDVQKDQLDQCMQPGGPQKYAKAIESDLDMTRKIIRKLEAREYEDVQEFLPVKFQRFSSIQKAERAGLDEALIEAVKQQRNLTKKLLKRWMEDFMAPKAKWEPDGNMKKQAEALLFLANEFDSSLRARKIRDGIMDFDDLETYAYQLLQEPAVSRRFQNRIRYVFVDEYQDTSEMQEAVLNCISKESQLFYVGDGKQSIYQFRGATPRLFINKAEGKDGNVSCIRLNHNFRSGEKIIHGINAFFDSRMTKDFGGVAYKETEQLKAGVKTIGDEKPQFVVVKGEVGLDAECQWVAGEIENLLNQGHKPNSIAVLARSLQPVQDAYRAAFQKRGIPFETNQPFDSKDQVVIEMFQALLAYLNSGISDRAFLAVMRFPEWKFTPEDMARIRIAYPKIRFEAASRKYSEHKSDELASKLLHLFQMLDDLRERTHQVPLGDLLDEILQRNDFADSILAMPDGFQKNYGLRAYVNMLKERGERQNWTLHHLCMLIQEEREAGISFPIPSVQGDQGVQLMTIHGSKGLEFDTVFLVNAGQSANLFELNQSVLIHEDFGLAMSVYESEQEAIRIPLERRIAQLAVRRQRVSEELRIYYVGMTRAVERLIVVAHDMNPVSTREKRRYLSTIAGGIDYPSLYHWMIGAGMDNNLHWVYREEEMTSCESLAPAFSQTFDMTFNAVQTAVEDTETYVSNALKKRKTNLTEWIRDEEIGELFFQKNTEAVDRGNAFHEVLEKMQLKRLDSIQSAAREIQSLRINRLITEKTASLVDEEKLFCWSQSNLGQRILKAEVVLREKSFVGRLPDHANALYAQGKLDCLFREGAGWVIVDYKLHFPHDMSSAIRQVKAYAELISSCFGMKINEAYLYEWETVRVLEVDLD